MTFTDILPSLVEGRICKCKGQRIRCLVTSRLFRDRVIGLEPLQMQHFDGEKWVDMNAITNDAVLNAEWELVEKDEETDADCS